MEYLYVIVIILALDFIYLFNAKGYIFKMVKKIQQEDVKIKMAPLFLIYADSKKLAVNDILSKTRLEKI